MTISYRIQTSLGQKSKLLFHGIQVQFSRLNCGRTEIQWSHRNSWDRRRPASGPTPSLMTAFLSSHFTLPLCRLDSSTALASCQRFFWKREPDFLSRTLVYLRSKVYLRSGVQSWNIEHCPGSRVMWEYGSSHCGRVCVGVYVRVVRGCVRLCVYGGVWLGVIPRWGEIRMLDVSTCRYIIINKTSACLGMDSLWFFWVCHYEL